MNLRQSWWRFIMTEFASSLLSISVMVLCTSASIYWPCRLSSASLKPQPFSLIGSHICSFAKLLQDHVVMLMLIPKHHWTSWNIPSSMHLTTSSDVVAWLNIFKPVVSHGLEADKSENPTHLAGMGTYQARLLEEDAKIGFTTRRSILSRTDVVLNHL